MLMIEKKRKEKGFTQTQLAYHAKMSAQDISRIERGWSKPYNGQAQRLSDVLEIPVDEIAKEV